MVSFLNRHFAVLVLLGYVAIHGLYHKVPADTSSPYWGTENHNIAVSIVEGEGFANPYAPLETGPSAWVAPPFPYLLAGIFWVAGTETPAAARLGILLQALLFGGTLWLLYSIVQPAFSTNCARLAALIWLINPNRIGLTSSHLSEVGFSSFGLLLAIFAFARFEAAPTWKTAALTGVAIGFATLCLPVLALALPSFALAIYASARSRTLHPWGRPVIALLLCGVVLVPWIIRNYVVFHSLVFVKSNFGQLFYYANQDESKGPALSLLTSGAERDLFREMGEVAYSRYSLERAIAWIRGNKKEFLARCIKRGFAFWVVNPATGLKRSIWYLYQVPFLATVAVGLWRQWRRGPVTILCCSIIICVPLVYYLTASVEQHRFRLPLEALLTIFVSAAWDRQWSGRADDVGGSQCAGGAAG